MVARAGTGLPSFGVTRYISTMVRFLFHSCVVVLLTLLSQLGGLAWLVALPFRRRLVAFVVAYGVLWAGAMVLAPQIGRVPLPCLSNGSFQMQSPLYCVLNRQYVTPDLRDVVQSVAVKMEARYPETKTLVLDANFPFVTGFPLLPHLSHNDGRKADLAFYYQDDQGYLPERTKSPIGYFAFEDGPSTCPQQGLTMRWSMGWLQPLWPQYALEPQRMKAVMEYLAADDRVGKIFLEPHLKTRFGLDSPKIRFQGCRAARHDDHIHLQL